MVAAARITGKADTAFAPKKGWALVKKRIWTSRYLYLLFLFPLLYFIIFKYGAMVWLTIAFKDYNAVQGLWKSEWIGFKHFVTFFQTPDILRLIRNTVLLSVYSLLWSFPMPIFLALMIPSTLLFHCNHLRHFGKHPFNERTCQSISGPVPDRSCQFPDQTPVFPYDLYSLRNLAKCRLGVHYLSCRVERC